MKRGLVVAGALAVAAVGFGCGSSSNNDQGVSFTLFGFYSSGSSSGTACSQPSAGGILTLDEGALGGDESESPTGPNLNALEVCYGLQNNLAVEGVRLQQAYMDYFIPGATVQPPSTSQPLSSVLGPAGSGTGGASGATGPDSSLPPGFDFPNEVRLGVFILPPDIISWLSLNRASLPELPYLIRVNTYVRGITTSGNAIDSNLLSYPVDVVIDNEVPPTDGGDEEGSEGEGEASDGAGEDFGSEGSPDDGVTSEVEPTPAGL